MKFIFLFLITVSLVSCGPSDEKILADVNNSLAMSGGRITASIDKGVVTLSGECENDPCKTNSETAVKEVKGVKQVVNNITIAAPPPPPPAVAINPDDSLTTALNNILADYKTVKTNISGGVVTLTGEIKRAQLTKLMQDVSAIKPKKIVNQLKIK